MLRRNSQPRMRLLLAGLVTAIGLMFVLFNPTLANATKDQVTKPNGPLTASWWQEFVEVTDPNTFMGCDVGTQKIVFLTGLSATVSTDHRSCTTDKTTFLVPLINVECSTAEGNGTTFEELARCAKEDFADYFTALNLTIDGQPIGDLNSLRVQAKGHFTPVPNNVLIPNISEPTNSKFATDGYWALITLTPGEHTITFGGTFAKPGTDVFTTQVTYNLTITDKHRGRSG
jgi:hypothetical protein